MEEWMDFERVVQWHVGQLAEQSLPRHFEVHVTGVDVGEGAGDSVRFHTYACLTPDGEYAAFITGKYTGLSIARDEMRGIITDFTPTTEQIVQQGALPEAHAVLPELRWEMAFMVARSHKLPVAFMVFGQTTTGELTVRQRSIVYAPLTSVRRAFAASLNN